MKRLLLLCFLCFSPLLLSGEGFTADFLRKVKQSRTVLDYSFFAEKNGETYSGSGVITLQDNAYRLVYEDVVIYDDLNANYGVNSRSREVVIESSNAADFFANPAEILSIMGLKSKKAQIDVRMGSAGTSFCIKATLADGMKITLKASVRSFSEKGPLSDFSFDTSSLGMGWMVTDLR